MDLYSSGQIEIFSLTEKNQIEKSLGILTSDLEVILTFSETEISNFLDIIDEQMRIHQEYL
jgi:RNA polymerase-interacting CarD/CdnL/TRCF family regulator